MDDPNFLLLIKVVLIKLFHASVERLKFKNPGPAILI